MRNLKNQGIYTFSKEAASIRGISDILGCYKGNFIALEVKKSKTAKRSALQEVFVNRITQEGGFARFVYPENMDQVISEILQLASTSEADNL